LDALGAFLVSTRAALSLKGFDHLGSLCLYVVRPGSKRANILSCFVEMNRERDFSGI
jgi:hypothetical protein